MVVFEPRARYKPAGFASLTSRNLLSSTLSLALADGVLTAVSLGSEEGLLASAVAGAADGLAVPVELPPGGPLNMLTVNMITKARATAASVTRGLRCFTAPPPPDGYAYWR
jgi:hypothetical protein